MPEDNREVVVVLVAVILAFLVLTGVVIYVLFFYQRRRFQHKHQIVEMQKHFSETLLTSQLEIQEHDFSIISREIHDNVGQILSLAKIQLNIISQTDHVDKIMVLEVKENIAKAMADLRDIARGLNTERVQVANLLETVRQEVGRINRSRFISGQVSVEGNERGLEEKKKLILFRIIQESLQNILKHSGATEFFIMFNYQPEALAINVTDNGKGFNTTEALNKKGGMGLANIQSRSELIGGNTVIDSKQGRGTIISINIPYE